MKFRAIHNKRKQQLREKRWVVRADSFAGTDDQKGGGAALFDTIYKPAECLTDKRNKDKEHSL
jgi:hypothetical protein